MKRLSPRERTVFEMKHYQGLRLRAIGDLLGTSEETVKNSLFRATQKAAREPGRDALAKEWIRKMRQDMNPDKDAMTNEQCSEWQPLLVLFAAGDELDVVQAERAGRASCGLLRIAGPRSTAKENLLAILGEHRVEPDAGLARKLPRKPGRRAGPRGRRRMAAAQDRHAASGGLDVASAGLERRSACDDRFFGGNVWPAVASAPGSTCPRSQNRPPSHWQTLSAYRSPWRLLPRLLQILRASLICTRPMLPESMCFPRRATILRKSSFR